MNSKKEIKLLTELLNLSGVKVISHRQHQGIGIILQIESINKESICPRCGIKSQRLHQDHRYVVKDLSWGEQQVFFEINRRQFKCSKCQRPFSEEINFVSRRRTYTKRLAQRIIQEVLDSDINSVARKGVVTTEEIERMLQDAASELENSKPLSLKRLGIDEIALVKGKGKYCAVLVDLDTSKLLAILNGRTQEIIKETLIGWGIEILSQIEEVSIDLWQGYKSLVTELMPSAQVVADRFHVMTQINQELERQRKREKRHVEDLIKTTNSAREKADYKQLLTELNQSKYPLLQNKENLNEKQLNQLIQVKNVSPTLKVMHELKEKFRSIFNQTNDWYTAVFKLGIWCSRAKKYFPNSNNTIIRWFDEIIAYFDNRTTRGAVEGINNKLKLIKRSGYGFRNFENFRVRCLLNWHLTY
jgi:transposase